MNTNTQEDLNNNQEQKKTPFIKKLGIFILVLVGISFFANLVSVQYLERNAYLAFISTNKYLTKQEITIDNVDINYANGKMTVSRFTLFNPSNYISPYAISIGQLESYASLYLTNEEMSALNDLGLKPGNTQQYYVHKLVILDNVKINYDISASSTVNLYSIIDNIARTVAPNANFSTLSILGAINIPGQKLPPVNYTGQKFYLGKMFINKPIVNIYNNRKLIKSVEIDSLALDFNNIQQPATYADFLLVGAVKVITAVDQAIRK